MPSWGPAPDLPAYFRRIGYEGPVTPSLEVLRELHRLHAAGIPFENLAAFLGEPIALDVPSLEDKLVRARRGGWCFEQNLLFARVLEAIGYPVRRLGARVRWNAPAGYVGPRSHMLLEVAIQGAPWLADVGFGGQSLTAPLRLEAGPEQETPHETFRLAAEDEHFVLEALLEGEWRALYAFDLVPQQLADYEVSNWYLAHHPRSHFVTGLVAARAAPGKRHALRNTRYTIHHRDGRTERRTLASLAELRSVLEGDLAIPLPGDARLDERLEQLVREEREGQ